MPNIKSAKKRVLINTTKAAHNKAVRSNMRTLIKKAEQSVAAGSTDSIQAVRSAIKRIDQAAAKGIIHKNTASRKKSSLASSLNTIK